MGSETLRDRWLKMSAEERSALAPSGRVCVEQGCGKPAGTPWGPYWCPDHDDERMERIDGSLLALTTEKALDSKIEPGWADSLTRAESAMRAALARHDAAQVQGKRIRIAVAQDKEGGWAVAGWPDAPDGAMMEQAEYYVGTESAAPWCYLTATLPPRPSVPEVEGGVE